MWFFKEQFEFSGLEVAQMRRGGDTMVVVEGCRCNFGAGDA
jgi:hypothetical protein